MGNVLTVKGNASTQLIKMTYKELTIIENTYMANGDDVFTIKRTVNTD